MYQRILLATDGTPMSRKAALSAIEMAACMKADLVAICVVPRYPTSFFEGGFWVEDDELARVERYWAERGQAAVDEVSEGAVSHGVRVRTLTVSSDHVADAILAAAKKHDCDLIVMASHGRKGIGRILLGSETQHVLTRGDVPVLVVR